MKASSESGECASLISTGSFSVFEAVWWPGMGVLGSSFRAARRGRGNLRCAPEPTGVHSPRLRFPNETSSVTGGSVWGRAEENLRVAGACVALGRAISYQGKPSISQAIATNAGLAFHMGSLFPSFLTRE